VHILKRLGQWILRWRFPAVPIIVALLLAAPSLNGGLQLDDYSIRATILDCHLWGMPSRGAWNPFSFLDGNPAHARVLIDRGAMPWWSDPHCRLAFLRPLTALTHIVDHRLWPGLPVLMHVQSLLWFALLIWSASVLYRRLIGRSMPVWTAAIAALLFAVDDAHADPVGWLANRNAALAGVFGILALIAHDRWRRDGWRPGAVLAPIALLAGLLCKETAVCAMAYLAAYALFLERERWDRRIRALLPCLAATIAWYAVYRTLGYGGSGSGVYVDPGSEPLAFARHVFRHAPILLLGQWGLPNSLVSLGWSTSVFWIHWLAAVVFLAVLGAAFARLLWRDGLARFWALGMFLSLLPACATFPSDRLLMFVGLGAMGLLAQFFFGLQSDASWLPSSPAGKRLARGFGYLLIAIHLVLSPLLLCVGVNSMKMTIGTRIDRAIETFPNDPQIEDQTVVFVNSTSWLIDTGMIQTLGYRGRPLPVSVLNLATVGRHTALTRAADNVLVVRPEAGYLPPAGWLPEPAPPASIYYFLQVLDQLVRNVERPMGLGETVELSSATIEITELTADNRPAAATFRFHTALEDQSLRWLELTPDGYRPFVPPAVGETVKVAPLIE